MIQPGRQGQYFLFTAGKAKFEQFVLLLVTSVRKSDYFKVYDKEQGRIQEFEKGGSFKRVRAERAEKFWVTTPTFPNHAHFS